MIFASIVLCLGGNDDSHSALAWRIVYDLRIGQSLCHWYNVSEGAVAVRFLFFVGQLSCITTMIYRSSLQ